MLRRFISLALLLSSRAHVASRFIIDDASPPLDDDIRCLLLDDGLAHDTSDFDAAVHRGSSGFSSRLRRYAVVAYHDDVAADDICGPFLGQY